jgi:uncharacterized iron-regulated membrane protein
LLFVIAFTGSVSVFGKPELKIWANPDIRADIQLDAQKIEDLVFEYSKTVPEEYLQEVLVFLPGARNFVDLTVVFENHEAEQAIYLTFDNLTLDLKERIEGSPREVFSARKTDIADFIVNFHADLHLGRPIGLLLTGLLGLTLMASVVTGFIVHRQKLSQLFSFRPKKGWDVTLSDGHKLFGLWGLVFHGVIGFSGAFLGLATVILIPAAAFVSFGGDQEKLIETFTTTPQPTISKVAEPTKLAPILEHALNYEEHYNPEVITLYGYGDQNAVVYVNGTGGERVSRQLLSYEGSTGTFKEAFSQFGKVGGNTTVILDLMFPLHFGNFGGVFVKLIWTVLGLATALLPLSGMMLWIERGQKSKHPQYSDSAYERFNRLVIGCCGVSDHFRPSFPNRHTA